MKYKAEAGFLKKKKKKKSEKLLVSRLLIFPISQPHSICPSVPPCPGTEAALGERGRVVPGNTAWVCGQGHRKKKRMKTFWFGHLAQKLVLFFFFFLGQVLHISGLVSQPSLSSLVLLLSREHSLMMIFKHPHR